MKETQKEGVVPLKEKISKKALLVKSLVVDITKKTWGRKYGKVALIGGALLLVGGAYFAFRTPTSTSVVEEVKQTNLRKTVLATGQVVSQTNLDLAFLSSGIVKNIHVRVGDTVKKGQIIAELDAGTERASVTSASGALMAAQARYQKVLDGVRSEELDIARTTLANAKIELENAKALQDTFVENAKSRVLSSELSAVPSISNIYSNAPVVSGSYRGGAEGIYAISLFATGNGMRFSYTGIESGDAVIYENIPLPLGTRGLYLTFPSGFLSQALSSSRFTIEIPNTRAVSYVSNKSALDQALQTRENALRSLEGTVKSAENTLALRLAKALPTDVRLAQAEVTQAIGSVQNARALYERAIVRAQASGTITKVDVKIGEQVTAGKAVIAIQDVESLYIEANINESNIGDIALGKKVELTFDGLQSREMFYGEIVQIDPAATIVSGVVNYKIKASAPKVAGVRPGMSVNMTIVSEEKNTVLVVPSRAILKKDARTYVRIPDEKNPKNVIERDVVLGLKGDEGTEIVSGLTLGEKIIVLLEQKKK